MSWNERAHAHRFAIDGELAQRLLNARRSQAGSEGQPAATRSIAITAETLTELLKTSPHDCDVAIEFSGHRDADGYGHVGVTIDFQRKIEQEPASDASGHAIAPVDSSIPRDLTQAFTVADSFAEGVPPGTIPDAD